MIIASTPSSRALVGFSTTNLLAGWSRRCHEIIQAARFWPLEWGISFAPRRTYGASSHSPHIETCHPSRYFVIHEQYPSLMPWGLKRYQNVGTLYFITFSCYRRQPLLMKHGAAQMFEQALEDARVRYGFFVFGYVVMPEHVHLLLSEPERGALATAIKAMKQSVARQQIKLGGGLRSYQQKDPHNQTTVVWGPQRVYSREAHRETEIHPPQPRPSRTRRATRRLALEQLSPLRTRRSRHYTN